MTYDFSITFKCMVALFFIFISGCIIVDTEAPVLKQETCRENFGVAIDGFISETVDVNPVYGTANTFSSGTGYSHGNSFNYSGTSSTTMTGFTMTSRETSVMRSKVSNMLADMGFSVMSPDPDYIVSGTYYGPRTDWRKWYMDAAVDIFTLTFCWNARTCSECEIRVFDRPSGSMVKKISVEDSYQCTSFSLLPLYGHMCTPKMRPNTLYPHCTKRVTVKAVNELTEWLNEQKSTETRSTHDQPE